MKFDDFFEMATGRAPYPYQRRLADEWFDLVNVPTGAGKTAAAILAWLWRRRFADKPTRSVTPRRLVYCLPMRVLVEQTYAAAIGWLRGLGMHVSEAGWEPHPDSVTRGSAYDSGHPIDVHRLMGGERSSDWHRYPERDAILIGTQDMLLSRALNRGYAASRFHWPIDFGLLNNDCLWVFDEPQLMGSGVSTSAQLAGLRSVLGTFGACPSLWMSATLEPAWLRTIDLREHFPARTLELGEEDYRYAHGSERPLHKRMTAEKALAPLGIRADKDGKDIARWVLELHRETGSQTLVVVNTVDRAKAVYQAIKRDKSAPADVMLIHSRFRPAEREELNRRITEPATDRIIVATQVVEAGVDLSARTLITELAPWASIVQRIGRCNRTGDDGPGRVFWIDLDPQKQAAPYESEELLFARDLLTKLELDGGDVSPKALDDFKRFQSITLPFEHAHVLRRRDLLDLFDTAPDLSGNDIDVQRFVRGDQQEIDVQVFWRAGPPDNSWDATERRRQSARRIELCNVPIGSFKDDFLGAGKVAFRLDYLDGTWTEIGKREAVSVAPGQVFWIAAIQGGYDPDVGWSPTASRLPDELLIPLADAAQPQRCSRSERFYDSDEWSRTGWKTIAEHTDDVVQKLATILDSDSRLPLPDGVRSVLELAARLHDWGKAHDVFQSGVADEVTISIEAVLNSVLQPVSRPDEWKGCSVVAKAPDEFWRRYSRIVSPADHATQQPAETRKPVKRFRHELATALGCLALEKAGFPPPAWPAPESVERLLALYLVASHHGKVRLSVRTLPEEEPVPRATDGRRYAAGIWDGDRLPGTDLGGQVSLPEVTLSLDAMQLGGDESWTAGVLRLRDDEAFGPFRLAYLEALLRAADCRASADEEDHADD